MKLAGPRARAFCRRPEAALRAGLRGALLHGPDEGLVARCRRELVTALTEGDDLRLDRLEGRAVERRPGELEAALRARGFFPGRRVVLVEAAGDGLARSLAAILAETTAEDAFLVITAGQLPARGGLRRLFEGAPDLAALGLYPDPPGAAALAALLAEAGLEGRLDPEARAFLAAFAAAADPATLESEIAKLALWAASDTAPIGPEELAALLAAPGEADLDALAEAVAAGRAEEVAPLMRRLAAAGTGPGTMLAAAARHFRRLLAVAAAPGGIDKGLDALRPPVFGPRRRALAAQAAAWSGARLEAALRLLFAAERQLRTPGRRPEQALVERALLRLALTAPGRGKSN